MEFDGGFSHLATVLLEYTQLRIESGSRFDPLYGVGIGDQIPAGGRGLGRDRRSDPKQGQGIGDWIHGTKVGS